MNGRERLAHWITALVDEIAPGYEAMYSAPMGWCSDLAYDIGEHLAELRETEREQANGCRVCGEPITQPATGRRRVTCTDRCRKRLSRTA